MGNVMQEITAARRRHHDARGRATVEHATADSRLWLVALGADFGRLVASLGPIEDLNEAPGVDPRDALLELLADGHAFLQAMDERPGVAVQTGVLERYGAGSTR
jgi:hypothetical protein